MSSNTTELHTRSSVVASAVLTRVTAHKGREASFATEYGGLAEKLPMLIRTAGLSQAMLYAEVRATKTGQNKLREDLIAVLGLPENAIAVLVKDTLIEHMQHTRQALAALVWFKRFSQSVLDYKPGTGVDNE